MRRGVACHLILLAVVLAGCTERRLFVRTEPPNAHVRVNGQELGLSPVGWRYDHYGTVRVEVERDGYHAEQRIVTLDKPWWQQPGADFFTDVVWPGTVRDDREVVIVLEPLPERDDAQIAQEFADLAEAAARLRAEVEKAEEGPEGASGAESGPPGA